MAYISGSYVDSIPLCCSVLFVSPVSVLIVMSIFVLEMYC